MNILLAEAPFTYEDAIVEGERYYPLGIGYIASFVRTTPGRNVRMFVGDMDQFRAEMRENPPDVLGISSMTNTYPAAAKMARIARECHPSCIIILGGQHVSSVGAEVLRDLPEVDFLCIGEGEFLMDRFLNEIESGQKDWQNISGLVYRTSAEIRENAPGELIKEIEHLPFPARDLVDLTQYKSHGQSRFGGQTASLITSRGCPWKCTYCSSHVTMGRRYRFLSADYVVAEFEELYKKYNVKNIVIWDDLFTFRHDRVYEICNQLINKGIKVNWSCMSRTDRMEPDIARIMRKAGCRMISFGIESGNEGTLARIRKNVKLDVVEKAIESCRKAGIRTQGSFILGFPWETTDEMEDTIRFALKSKLEIAIFFSFTPYPGTDEWQFVPPEQRPQNVDEWKRFVCNNEEGRTWNNFLDD